MPAIVKGTPRRRWRIAWLLGLGVLVNYFDRVNLSVSHGALYAAFGISDVAFGYLSAAYNWSYAFCQLPVGVVLDRLGCDLLLPSGPTALLVPQPLAPESAAGATSA